MQIIHMELGPLGTNCYIVIDETTKKAGVIDPAYHGGFIKEQLDKQGLSLEAILLTHGHADHIGGLEELRRLTGAPVYIGEGDLSLISNSRMNLSLFMGKEIVCQSPEHILHDGDEITIGSMVLQVLATPGHSKGGVCFYDKEAQVLFSGDTLFRCSIGRTDLYGGFYEQLLESIQEKLMVLPDSVQVYPGHGPSTDIGTERRCNPYVEGRG